MADDRWDFWNSPFYKPKIKLSPIFWDDFMFAAAVILENQRRRIANPLDKDPNKKKELEVYDVFDWLRQQVHEELPYTQKRCETIDAHIHKEVELEKNGLRRANKTTG